MKKFVLSLFFLLTAAFLLIACSEEKITTPAVSDSTTPIATDFTTPAAVTSEEPGLSIPPDYYEEKDFRNCSSVRIPAQYNEGIECDILPIIDRKAVYFLLPSCADLSQVVYHLYDSKGNFLFGQVADFTQEERSVLIFHESYPIVALRSDSPTLYLTIDESYGTMEDVRDDPNKNTKAYGDLLLTCRTDVAEKLGCKTRYESRDDDPDSPCSFYIKGRGNWSWYGSDKRGYSIKLENKADLLAMGANKKWALIAATPDHTLLRNSLAYRLATAVGMPYTSSGVLVDLFINGEYLGTYLLSEKVEIGEDRVDIYDLEKEIEDLMDDPEDRGTKKSERLQGGGSLKYWTGVPDPEDITGGYLFEMEMPSRYAEEPSGFVTRRGYYYVIKSPEYASRAQVNYLFEKVQAMEDALFSEDGCHPETGKHYSDYIDLESIVKKYWIEEISKNHDGVKTSQYYYKPADSESEKFFAGPVWDYDIAFGVSSETTDPEGWFMQPTEFFGAFWRQQDFADLAKNIFLQEFYPAISKLADSGIAEMADEIRASIAMNDIRWHMRRGSYDDAVKWLTNYLRERADWIYRELS